MDEPFYQLTIIDMQGQEHRVFGTKGQLEPAYRKWAEGEYAERIAVDGHTNTCDRAPLSVCLRADEVRSMHLHLYA